MNSAIFSYAEYFWHLSPLGRLLRLCRIAFGVLLVLPLAALCVFLCSLVPLAESLWERFVVVGFASFLGLLSIAGIRVMVWRPAPPTVERSPPFPPEPPPEGAPVPAPLIPNTPLTARAAKELPKESDEFT